MTFEEFYETNKTLVYRLCRARTSRDLAEESTARAFIEIWRRWEKVSQMESPVAYTVTVARNIAYKEYLKSKARMVLGLDIVEDLGDESDTPEYDYMKKESLNEFWEAMAHLSSREREIIVIKDLEERSFQECADLLGLSLTATKSLRHRARVKLSKILTNADSLEVLSDDES